MKNTINNIVKELLELDPSFSAHEAEMRALIAEFLAKKPDTHLDDEFVARLRSRLLGVPVRSPFTSFFSPQYVVLGVLVALLVVPLGFYAAKQGTGESSGSAVFAMNQEIQHLQGGAYGTIQEQAGGRGGGIGLESAPTAAPMTSSDSAAPTMANTTESEKVSTSMAYGAGGGTTDSMMVPQGPITVTTYVYKGDPLELSGDGDVFSRVKNSVSSAQIATQLKKFNFGLVNLNGFADTRVRSFELAEDKPYGYSIMASFDDGTISINPNYTEWPGLNGKEAQQVPVSAMPKDTEVLAIAKKFLNEHDINLSNYGDPIVQQYADFGVADTGVQYAPEQVTVTYPLKISGTPVYEDGAYPYGLQLGVSVRDKRVMSVYGLTSQTYSSSDYKLETDSDKILSVLEKGGPHAWVPEESDVVQIKKVEVEVGTPQKVLIHTYTYSNGESKELFVPALNFPVTKAPEGEQHYPKNIVIPLVPGLLNETQGGPVLYDAVR